MEPFIGEVKIVGFNFPPRGWATCDGQMLPIQQYQSLYSILGTTYGGDGRTTFALPDLRGRTPIHVGSGPGLSPHGWGQKGGQEAHPLSDAEMPVHKHDWKASANNGDSPIPTANVLAAYPNAYRSASSALTEPVAGTLANAGTGQGHQNMQPFLTLNYVIALVGIFPPRN